MLSMVQKNKKIEYVKTACFKWVVVFIEYEFWTCGFKLESGIQLGCKLSTNFYDLCPGRDPRLRRSTINWQANSNSNDL